MPLSLDPNALAPYSLKSDAAADPATRAVFLFRFLSFRQSSPSGELRRLIDASIESDSATPRPTPEQDNAATNAILALFLAGWRNIPVPFSIEATDDVLTTAEKWELILAVRPATRLAELDKKKSDSPSAGATAASAAPAPQAEPAPPAVAATSPTPNAPSTSNVPPAAV